MFEIKKLKWGVVKRIKLLKKSYEKIFLDKGSNFYFIGIGGIGMSAIAFVMQKMGYKVSGSDMQESGMTKKLQDAGIKVFIGHERNNLPVDTDLIIVSSAIPKKNPEINKALELGIPIVKRSFVLGQIMKMKKGIAISGTHGKTTTTTMVSLILKNAGLDPVSLIGGEVKNIGGNYLAGDGEYLVAEACEYDRSFLDLHPHIAIITNIEEDHLDYYRDINEIKDAFKKFVSQIDEDGLLIIYADDPNNVEIAKSAKCKVYGYGFSSKNRMQNDILDDYLEVDEIIQNTGETNFSLSDGKSFGGFSLHIPGKHNVANACAAVMLTDYLGIDLDVARNFLKDFSGTNRRFQIKGQKNDIIVIDDYAHHPTEIKSTLEGARKFYKEKEIIVVFEPHQYSRTHLLRKEFADSFRNSNLVIIPDIYSVRDTDEDRSKISAQDLVGDINSNGTKALHIPGYENVVNYLNENVKPGSVIMTIGAGGIYKIGEDFLKK